ncbi:hypothetical protein DZC73_07845 [Albitalea terrae]|uniref:Bacterial repeat domain-containing protein n=1 Tax=Piscinibacter terrae TaxID=2496871 RepID=A0A3N7HU14_9BURK|nr:hypothetical protein DZC73_07845 [Albitalea terrae]
MAASCGGGGSDAGSPPFGTAGSGGLSPTKPTTPTSGTQALTVTVIGSGSVISSPAGVNCTSVCTTSFSRGTLVQLTATPGTGVTFSGWTGDCTGQSCSVSMTTDHKVVATFQ